MVKWLLETLTNRDLWLSNLGILFVNLGGLGLRKIESMESKCSDSILWKSILDTRDIIKHESITLAAKGDSIDVWRQSWIPSLNHHKFDDLMESLRPCGYTIKIVVDLSSGSSWDLEKILQIFGEILGERIMAIPPVPLPHSNKLIWKPRKNGILSVKDAYYMDQAHCFALRKEIWNRIWSPKIHPRLAIML
ncbi:hypothetical protein G4B88_004957 [Cannabis sativa]|uniref:Uncharacterized protein n=1 Tax=Cannabis sativa TaxID=3483 RepID=A0A7J6FZH9_CANSA|nr:hypothetical protein G4B88_004957 [Cannabis sativa]